MRGHERLRASDADRDAVIDRLREALGEGRLESDELEQRVERALHARTYGQLEELLADLPGDGRVLWRHAGSRTNSVARSPLLGAGLLVAVTLAFVLVALVAMLVLAAAAWCIAIVLFWLVCRGSRRRFVPGPFRGHSIRARHAHRPRPTGLL
jgi:Flp pilus assembly protein TadB